MEICRICGCLLREDETDLCDDCFKLYEKELPIRKEK